MAKLKYSLVFYILLALDFYVIPLFMKDTGSAMVFMLVIIPAVCFAVSFAYGIKKGFRYRYALIAAVMFVPSVFIFYNLTALVYAAGYGLIALLGNLAAMPFYKRKKKGK